MINASVPFELDVCLTAHFMNVKQSPVLPISITVLEEGYYSHARTVQLLESCQQFAKVESEREVQFEIALGATGEEAIINLKSSVTEAAKECIPEHLI